MFSRLKLLNFVFLLAYFGNGVHSKFESFIVGGDNAAISKFPHSAFLAISCPDMTICGSSILNQMFLLTAAHCLYECLGMKGTIWVMVGSANTERASRIKGNKFITHPDYSDRTLINDIGLLMVSKPMQLGQYVKRIVLVKKPPKSAAVYVAGWGMLDEYKKQFTKLLMHTKQRLWTRSDCSQKLGKLAPGTICAGAFQQGGGYAAAGDSGSALVVDGYIQIGIVSFKNPSISPNLVVYTDVCYFYDWIMTTVRKLYCNK